MAYKISFILSFIFVAQIFLMGADLISIQYIYSELDSLSISVGHMISLQGGLNQNIKEYVSLACGGEIYALNNEVPSYGNPYTFFIKKPFDPFVLSEESIDITVKRSVLIGYYE